MNSSFSPQLANQAQRIFETNQQKAHVNTDLLFGRLLFIEYFVGILIAILLPPTPKDPMINAVYAAAIGAVIVAPTLYLIHFRTGTIPTRHAVAISQMLVCSLWIFLTGERFETHFHIFVSLAVLAAYRDWKVLVTASSIAIAALFFSGLSWPTGIFIKGVNEENQWTWFEHVSWVVFEDIILLFAIRQSLTERRRIAYNQAGAGRIAASLRRSELEYRTIFELSGSAKSQVSDQGDFVMVNQRFCEMTGYTKEELSHMKVWDLIPEDERDARIRNIFDLINGNVGEVSLERRFLRKNGSIFWGYVTAGGIRDEETGRIYVFSTMQDITPLKEAQKELAEAKARAEEASEAKSAFLANMSHEIRTPLGAMLGFAQLMMENEKESTERKKHLETILRNGNHLYRIVNDILDISKVEANKFDVDKVQFPLAEVIEDVTSLLSFKAREKGIEFNVRSIGPLPETIYSDPNRFKQILMNIIGNAIKFTEKGRVDVSFRLKHREDDNFNLEVQVSDTGPGIPEDKRKYLFEPFFQADRATTRRFGGAGLGLYLAKRLSQALGGDLTAVSSKPQLGTTFLARIDAGPCEQRILKPAPVHLESFRTSAGTEELAAALKNIRVLVVDDSPDNLELTSHFLAYAGAEVTCVEGGEQALSLLKKRSFDVIVMDIQMPGLDGYQAVRSLRAMGYTKPVIALTAHAMKGEREKCIAAGFDSYLVKPIDRQALIQSVRAYAPAKVS